MEIQKSQGEGGETIFSFIKNAGTVDIPSPSLLDAKLEFLNTQGYWPDGSA